MMAKNKSSKYSLLWIVGLCAFVSLMCKGVIWVLGLLSISFSLLSTLGNVASIILYVVALGTGWIWISGTKMNKRLKLVLEVLFLIFAIMCICGQLSL